MKKIILLLSLLLSNFLLAQPTIIQHPVNQQVIEGNSVSFSIVASSSDTIFYQWFRNGTSISGQTASTFTIPTASLNDNGDEFYCEVSDTSETLISETATLSVIDASSRIVDSLKLLYVFENQSGNIISDISGTNPAEDITIITPDKVAWTKYGLETFKDANTRRVTKGSKIINAVQATNEITIEAWFKPEYSPQPNGRILSFSVSGNYRNFSLIQKGKKIELLLRTSQSDENGNPGFISSSNLSGTPELTHYVFTKDNNGIAKIYINGQLDTSYSNVGTLEDWSSDHWLAIGSEPLGGAFWRGIHYLSAVYNRALSPVEVEQNFNIKKTFDTKPFFTIHPQNANIVEGESVFLDSYAVSVLPTTYQWRKNGDNISGATERQLTINDVSYSDNGSIYTCLATTSSGTVSSNSATINVTSKTERVMNGLVAEYNFKDGKGKTIEDNISPKLDITIFDTTAVSWKKYGMEITKPTSINTTSSASKIISAIKNSNEFTFEAWIKSASLAQSSPSKIFTISSDANNRNFTLGQNNDTYEINLRTTETDDNGIPNISSTSGTVSTDFDHIVFSRFTNGEVTLFINGTVRIQQTIGGDLSNWNDSYLLALGNEIGADDHPWKGLLNMIAIYDRALNNAEVNRNFNYGPYAVVKDPTSLTVVENKIGKVKLMWTDNSSNELGFIIERGIGNNPTIYNVIDTVATDSSYYVDSSVVDNTLYSYRVKAYNALGLSDYSNVVSILAKIHPIIAPTNLQHILTTTGHPKLSWTDNSDNELGFVIERKISAIGAEYLIIDSTNANIQEYTDFTVEDSTIYIYKIYAFNQDTLSTYVESGLVEVLTDIENIEEIPTEYQLNQNYPNPFNPTTIIRFGLPENATVSLAIYNILGQQVSNLLSNKSMNAGYYNYKFDALSLPSGIYVYKLNAKNNKSSYNFTKKMLLIK